MKRGEGQVRISVFLDIRFGTVDAEFGTASGWQQMPVTTSLSNSWGGGLDFRYRPKAVVHNRKKLNYEADRCNLVSGCTYVGLCRNSFNQVHWT